MNQEENMLKQRWAWAFALMTVFSLAACRGNSFEQERPPAQPSGAARDTQGEPAPMPSTTKNILVVYFSHSGNTREIAKQIQQSVGGDIFEIVPVDPYPADYQDCVDQARRELESEYQPKLKNKIKNLAAYQVIFIGYPNWWSTLPRPVVTFLTDHDLSGKTIAPFCTHEGSGLGRSVADMTKLCPKTTLLEGLAVRGTYVKNAQAEVAEWLMKIGMLAKK
jgi:flavodoxin